jgi:purine-binding chemotaxis protein CheW
MASNVPMTSSGTAIKATSETFHGVGFTVGSEEFCVDILKVQEIIRMVPITAMPNAPEFVEGVINLRGKIIPVIDFRKRFHIYDGGEGDEETRRIIVVSFGTVTVGMIVDKVSQVIKITSDLISPTPDVVKGFDSDYISGVARVGDRLIILLELEVLFAQYGLDQMGEVAA